MKKGLIFLLLFGMLLIIPLVQAQTYSGFERFTDNIKLFFSFGDNKLIKVLEMREKEVNSAMENALLGNEKKSDRNLKRAWKKLQFIQKKLSPDTAKEVKENSNAIRERIVQEKNTTKSFEVYVLEEEKTGLTAELTEKTYEYCEKLAKEDFALMLKEEKCNPETAPEPIKDDLEKLKDLQLRMFVKLMLEIRSCIDDPGTCNCEANVDVEQKAKCEKMVALAMKCEYKNDETSCNDLKAMEPKKGDNFAESFVPGFLMNLFGEKSYMIEYDINHSDGVPEECWDYNDKPECRQYDYLKETKEDWDEYGNYIGKRPKNKEPTMRESIPQCFDENGNFLEEKCGKITIIRNEEGLVNYLVENEIDNIIKEFENKSTENTINEGEWEVVEGGNQTQTEVNEIEIRIDEIDDEISNWVVENDIEGEEGDDGLVPFVKTEVANGDNGLKPEVKTSVAGDGTSKDEPLAEPDLNQVNPDLENHDTTTNEVAEGDGGEGDYAEGTTAGGIEAGNTGVDSGTSGTNDVAP